MKFCFYYGDSVGRAPKMARVLPTGVNKFQGSGRPDD